MNSLKALVAVLVVGAATTGCGGSKLVPPPPDAGHDALVDRAADGGTWLACMPLSALTGCDDSSGECVPTWADVLAHPYCPASADAGTTNLESRLDCGAYKLRRIDHRTTFDTYYYDGVTGKLVEAKTDRPTVAEGTTCYGPAHAIADCSHATELPVPACPADGGATD